MENFREKQGPLPSDVGPAAKGIGRVMSSRRFARHFVFFFFDVDATHFLFGPQAAR